MRLTLLTACLFGFVVFVCPKSIDTNIQVRLNNNPPQISIINGIPAQAGEFPFMASLLFPFTTGYRLCGGSLIASSYILTAGHCVDNLPTDTGNGYVFINTLNITGGGPGSLVRRVSSYVKHQQYFANETNVLNDIALLILDQPVPATANVPFVKLPTALSTTTTLNPTTTTPRPTTTTPRPTTTTPRPTTTTPKPTTTTPKPTTTTRRPTTTTPKPTTTTRRSTTTTPKPTTTTPKPTTTTRRPTTTTPKPTTTTRRPTTTPKPTTTTPKPTTTTRRPTTTTPRPSTSTRKVITTSRPVITSTIKTTTKRLAALLRAFNTYSNESAIITGWGVTSSGSTSQTLQKANVTVYDNTVCNQQWGTTFDGSTQLCAAQLNTAICFGDSGGPILVNGNVQIGISSFVSGSGCDDPTHVPVFVRVSAYLDWIAATMASNPPPASGK